MNSFESCKVEARFTSSGTPQPKIIHWHNESLSVVDEGRHWETEDEYHLLVHVTDGRTFELVYDKMRWRGRVVSHPPHHYT
jgi:hypothetical protein